MRTLGMLMVALALAGCSLLKANPENPNPAATAANIGSQVGQAACAAAIHKDPSLAPKLLNASAKGTAALASENPTLAGVSEAVASVGGDAGFYASLAVPALVGSLTAAGVNVNTVEPGSPLAAGLSALFAACGTAAGGVA